MIIHVEYGMLRLNKKSLVYFWKVQEFLFHGIINYQTRYFYEYQKVFINKYSYFLFLLFDTPISEFDFARFW